MPPPAAHTPADRTQRVGGPLLKVVILAGNQLQQPRYRLAFIQLHTVALCKRLPPTSSKLSVPRTAELDLRVEAAFMKHVRNV